MARTVSEIVELIVYPIKSCRGVKVDETTLTRQGLSLDRRWMFVNAHTKVFITIRNNPRLTLIDTALSSDTLTVSIRNTDKRVAIPLSPSPSWLDTHTELVTVDVWEHLTDAYQYSSLVNQIFSDFLGEDVALVCKGPTARIARGNGAKELLGREESVNFPDVLPVLIASYASLSELNSRLKEKGEEELTIERFRPNIIVRGDTPWSEDTWKTVRINRSGGLLSSLSMGFVDPDALDIDVVARCARCQVPNVNPATAEKHPKQPWETLMGYRRVDPGMKWKPCFGMLGCPRQEGRVAVGMRFEVLESMGEGRWKGKEHVYETGF